MFESTRSRVLLAVGVAVVAATAFVAFVARLTSPPPAAKAIDPLAVWKKETGVDLAELVKRHPPQGDSEEARALDRIVEPLDLHLGARFRGRRRHEDPGEVRSSAIDALRDDLRAAIRAPTTEPRPLSPAATSFLEKHAAILDAVAAHVSAHDEIRWKEDFGPRDRSSWLYSSEHLALHRFLIGRAFVALDRGDRATAASMLDASQKLGRIMEARQELDAQFTAVGIERLQLALIRRSGGALPFLPKQPLDGLRERYRAAMSAEALRVLNNAKRNPLEDDAGDDDLPDVVVRVLAGARFAQASSARVAHEAKGVGKISRSVDGCAELRKERRAPQGFFEGNFYIFNATEAWRHFVVLSLDRAMTGALLTGNASSPCPSVSIEVKEDENGRTVEATGLPAETEGMVGLPPKVTASPTPGGTGAAEHREEPEGRGVDSESGR